MCGPKYSQQGYSVIIQEPNSKDNQTKHKRLIYPF